MINFNDIGSWHFVSELDVIEVTTASNVAVSIAASDGALVLEGTYIAVNGQVRIYGLHRLLSPLINESVADFKLTVGTTTKTVHVVQCRIDTDEGASQWLTTHFLTTVTTERDTALDRKELLTVLPTETAVPDVTATADYYNGSSVVSATRTLASNLSSGKTTEVDVSAASLADATLGQLVAYTVTCGKRALRYRVALLPTARYAFLLRNNFGAWEALYFTGSTDFNPEYTRESAVIKGRLTVYDLEETAVMKTHTGPLRPSGVALALDAARCRELLLLDDGKAGDAVGVTAVDVKHSTADDDIRDFTFTWRREAVLSAKLEKPKKIPKLFDSTFDDTYN